MEEPERRKICWERYLHEVDIHKGYLELAVKLNVFYYAITGAIVSFYFVHSSEPMIKYSLILPITMSTCLAVLFYYGAKTCKLSQTEIDNLAGVLEFDTCSLIPNILRYLLLVFFVGLVLVIIGLLTLLLKDIHILQILGLSNVR